ncbi:hypothetical protein SPSYN_01944 [Sporotomaculum syntrophicum]|uniref:Uroporphyrinogen decarboxylase (URO-D) n=1 Tax=Sporotomaculum syntrophicum TaxID=182264 RepID=A0A9D2WNY6_9FIRM|nr:hypothetical protein [Sporotomaculum syntrophicum]KAF1084774.1 hypothetical protein SPSYN_01944 [Sporotomaculum syntrophicum]
MDYLLKPDYAAARQRHRDFWQHKTADCPLLYIKAKKAVALAPWLVEQKIDRKEAELDINWHINQCRSQILAYDFLADSMPIANVMFGRDITNMGVLSGYDFVIHPVTEFITFAQDADFLFAPTPEFNQDNFFVQQVLAIYQGVRSDVGQLAGINPPTTADALTTMAMIMGMEQFLKSLYKHPVAVQQKAMALNRLFYSFYDYIYQHLLAWGYGESASWFPVFAEGKFDSIRSDISVMLSGQMFAELAWPVIADACTYLDYAMFNLDSVKLIRFLQPLAEIKQLHGIYWNIEPWLNNLQEYLPVLKQIKEFGLLLALPCRDVTEAKLAINGLGKNGLLLEFPVFEEKSKGMAVAEAVADYASHCLY